MEIKMFYKTQREIAEVINYIIDSYWDNEVKEEDLIQSIRLLYSNNPSKIMRDDKFTTIIQQQCGKRRLEVVDRILELNEIKLNRR